MSPFTKKIVKKSYKVITECKNEGKTNSSRHVGPYGSLREGYTILQ